MTGVDETSTVRLGILCESLVLEDWQARCLRTLVEQADIEPALVVLCGSPAPGEVEGREGARCGPSRLWAWYSRGYVKRRSRARQPADLTAIIPAHTRVMQGVTFADGRDGAVSRTAARELQQANLDVILQFGGRNPGPEVLAAAKLGVWRFSVEMEQAGRGTPPCFWELYSSQPIVATSLHRISPEGSRLLQRSVTRALPHSYVRTLDATYYAAAGLPLRACKDVLAGDAGLAPLPASRDVAACACGVPNTWQTLRFMLVSAWRYVTSLWEFLMFEERWQIGIVPVPIQDFLHGPPRHGVSWLPNDRGGFYADPFGVERDGRLTILAERFDRAAGKGEIVALEAEGSGQWHRRVILKSSYSMSYPYLLTLDGEVYCLPETSPGGEVVLHRGNPFPNDWESVTSLLKGFVAIDSTVFRYGAYWWLFCTGRPMGDELSARTYKGGADSTLFVWYAEHLHGPWSPHVLNPVKVDVRSSRPAGTPFAAGNSFYRPAQDCSRTYGGSVVLNRIVCLTPTSFAEEAVGVVEPFAEDGLGKGLHTVSAVGSRTLVDGKRLAFAPWSIPAKLAFIARRLLGRPAKSAGPERR